MKHRSKKQAEPLFLFSWKDLTITLLILTAAAAVSFLLNSIDGSDTYVPMIFVMAVFLISKYTNGYLFGIVSSFIGVILVNYIFTYPYFAFNFTISGYPITFISMFIISIMTSTMTTQIKKQERIKIEADKEKMRGNLLRAVSHDLRTPLTSILGTTSALIENGDKISVEQQRRLLQESHDEAEWLIRIVENLLSVTRMNGGKAKINKVPEAVEEIVGEAVRKFKKRFPDAGISVSVPDELLLVPMDAILIEQVVINLLENAVIHGKNKNGIAVSVIKKNDMAMFTVSDQGVGISEEAFKHLFDGYLSGKEEDDSDSKRNMGIGLSVCRSIVKVHGGELTAKNQDNGGAKFSFNLPLE
jgi:two-component system sensor histidine kinase KdpD